VGVGFVDSAVMVNWRGSVEDGGGLLPVSDGLVGVKKPKTRHDESRVSFRDAPFGPPTSWVPPGFILLYPFVEQCQTSPHPSEEGRGTVWLDVHDLGRLDW